MREKNGDSGDDDDWHTVTFPVPPPATLSCFLRIKEALNRHAKR